MNTTVEHSITTFQYAGKDPVRTSVIEGKIWFVAKDVCTILGISKHHDAIRSFETDEKGLIIVDTRGGRQSMTALSEEGIWKLVFRSRKPVANAFRKWVTATVLPALRTTGTYTVPAIGVVQVPAVPTSFSQALFLAATQAKLIEVQEAQLALEAPKVAFFDTVASSSDTTDIGTVAKTLAIPGLGRTTLFQLLRDKRVLMDNNRPYQRYVDAGYFRVIETSWSDPDGNQHIYFKTVVYQRGLDFIQKLVQDRFSCGGPTT
jgi:prophage antirepressor-like protein